MAIYLYQCLYTCTLCISERVFFEIVLQESTGFLSAEQVCETCFQYNLPVTSAQLSLLVRWCSEGEEGGEEKREEDGGEKGGGNEGGEEEGGAGEGGGGVRYRDLVELVNWQQEPSSELEERVKQRNSTGEWSHQPGLYLQHSVTCGTASPLPWHTAIGPTKLIKPHTCTAYQLHIHDIKPSHRNTIYTK